MAPRVLGITGSTSDRRGSSLLGSSRIRSMTRPARREGGHSPNRPEAVRYRVVLPDTSCVSGLSAATRVCRPGRMQVAGPNTWAERNKTRPWGSSSELARRVQGGIDETRADFPRVEWGSSAYVRQKVDGEPDPLVQMWFAGNHSAIGGSYPEAESRLSDIALGWMVEQATSIPYPLLVDGIEPGKPGIGRLRLHPAFDGMQHCEVAGMHLGFRQPSSRMDAGQFARLLSRSRGCTWCWRPAWCSGWYGRPWR
jgi:hypothetical protein